MVVFGLWSYYCCHQLEDMTVEHVVSYCTFQTFFVMFGQQLRPFSNVL